MKILYSWGHNDFFAPSVELEIAELQRLGLNVTSLNHRRISGIQKVLKPAELETLYRGGDQGLCRLYDAVRRLADDHDLLFVNHENPYHPEFLRELRGRIYAAYCSGDDPDSSEYCSRPYVASYDHSFAWGVRFDSQTTVVEQFKEWGAKRTDWWPFGVRSDAYDSSLTVDGIDAQRRDLDVVFAGTAWLKEERLLKLKKHFGRRLRLYGKWGRRDRLKNLMWVKSISQAKTTEVYRRAKIGINIHITFGPCNMRLYELPANGAMQVCDCADGLGQVFEVGKEIVAYRTMDEATDLIEYYLAHDKERLEIAVNGYRRVMKDYKRATTFCRALERMQRGMRQDGIKVCKDGSPLKEFSSLVRTAGPGPAFPASRQ